MQIHDLKPKSKRITKKPRVGRGGKRGTTSGHGTKGQKSRAGHRIRPAVRDLIQRLPKLRGYANNPKSSPARPLNVDLLEKSGISEVNRASLIEAKLIRKTDKKIKILSGGEIKRKITVSADILISKAAKSKIEAVGGKIVSK